MSIDYDHVEESPHRCELPSRTPLFEMTSEPQGARFHCDCGLVWIVRHVPPYSAGTRRVLGYRAWFLENRRERRRRLGLKWWQWG